MIKLPNCHDCGEKAGQPHLDDCDMENCSVCGGQKIFCDCKGHDKNFARWTGIWPGEAECLALGLYCKWDMKSGWVECDKFDPEASGDLNKFHELGLHKIFFVKPK